jgi:hypothetical protein
VIDFYNEKTDFDLTTNTVFVSELLVKEFGANPNEDKLQELSEGIVIYPSTCFCLDLPKNYASHHFIGSWHLRDTPNPFKDYVHTRYKIEQIVKLKNGRDLVHNVLFNHKDFTPEEFLDKIPLRMITKYIQKKIVKKLF